MGPSPWGPKAAVPARDPGPCSFWALWAPFGPHGPYQILKETYQILKETYPILKETYQILSPYWIRALKGPIRPYRALAPSAASPREVILAKIAVLVKYPVNLRIETGKMISVA